MNKLDNISKEKKTVLIVDDESINLKILLNILKPCYRCCFALNSEKAFLIANSIKPPDIILLDVIMPSINGYELCKKLKSHNNTKDIPVIFVTSKNEEDDETRGFELGAIDYLSKPVSPAIVLARIENHLALKTARENLAKQNTILEKKVNERTLELKKNNDFLKQMLKEKQVLLKEIHHRVKNNLQFISSILALQTSRYKDEKIHSIFLDYTNRIKSIAFIHDELYKTKNYINVDMVSYIKNLEKQLLDSYNISTEKIKLSINIDNFSININYAIPCGLIINELISNSLKFAFPGNRKGIITITLKQKNKKYSITVKDNGIGFPENFNFENSKTFGMQLINILINQLNGSIEFKVKKGTVIILKFLEPKLFTYNPIT